MKAQISDDTRVSESALIERINKRLAVNSQDLKESRMIESPSLGHFYEHLNSIADRPGAIDLESIGRELGVLMPGEMLTPDN
ncbi:MAG TPA: hypothetical protein VEV84_10655 [Pyrinomonadaceae bacterium]|jgi:hypothetical protein|nr:hypothetical protein [Pyrinomonadaceae bacterium]